MFLRVTDTLGLKRLINVRRILQVVEGVDGDTTAVLMNDGDRFEVPESFKRLRDRVEKARV